MSSNTDGLMSALKYIGMVVVLVCMFFLTQCSTQQQIEAHKREEIAEMKAYVDKEVNGAKQDLMLRLDGQLKALEEGQRQTNILLGRLVPYVESLPPLQQHLNNSSSSVSTSSVIRTPAE
jgi:hypothetical protein